MTRGVETTPSDASKETEENNDDQWCPLFSSGVRSHVPLQACEVEPSLSARQCSHVLLQVCVQ
jgi:hypothetical protein